MVRQRYRHFGPGMGIGAEHPEALNEPLLYYGLSNYR